MSRIIVDAVRNSSASTDGITLASDGSVTLPGNATCSGTATGFGGGKILQVKQTKLTSAVSITGVTSYADISSLSVDITPASASNKILVMVNMQVSTSGEAIFKLVRNSTDIGNSTAGAHTSFYGIFGNSNRSHYYDLESVVFNFLDDAQDTNAHTYKVQWSNITNVSTYLNRTAYSATGTHYSYSGSSGITVMELAA